MSACDICADTGWRIVETADGSHAERCVCHTKRARELALRRAGVPSRYDHCELSSFEVHHPSHKQALRIAERFVAQFPVVEGEGLLFMGPCGVGKTHLAVGITRELIQAKDVAARFADFRELLKQIQESYNRLTESSEKDVLAPVLECELLVLDDLGAEKPSLWVRDTIAYILNDRYKAKRPVVISTNLVDEHPGEPGRAAYKKIRERALGGSTASPDLLVDRIGVPTRSRLREMCKIVPLEGSDYRAHKIHSVDSTFGGSQS